MTLESVLHRIFLYSATKENTTTPLDARNVNAVSSEEIAIFATMMLSSLRKTGQILTFDVP